MNKPEIDKFLDSFQNKKDKTIVIVDFGNVEKWKRSLKWIISIKQLARLAKNLSLGQRALRRFYYGSDYGSNESTYLTGWSKSIMEKAKMNKFSVVTKRVKYIHSRNNEFGFEKKSDLDVEMAIDLVKLKDNYEIILLFSGDGDLVYALKYLNEFYNKKCYIFSARNHTGREIFEAKRNQTIKDILFAEDFEFYLKENAESR